jgi:hypothetical protein
MALDLVASTWDSYRDWASFARMRRFMMIASAALTALHVLIVFTPLYDVIARHLLGAPEEIIEPGRTGLRLMLPWTWSIAYRRFHQGVLIRFGRSGMVGRGTGPPGLQRDRIDHRTDRSLPVSWSPPAQWQPGCYARPCM